MVSRIIRRCPLIQVAASCRRQLLTLALRRFACSLSASAVQKFDFTGGTIHKVVFDVANDAYIDLEKHLLAAIARD